MGADGSYTYVADQTAADSRLGDRLLMFLLHSQMEQLQQQQILQLRF